MENFNAFLNKIEKIEKNIWLAIVKITYFNYSVRAVIWRKNKSKLMTELIRPVKQ